MAKSEQKKIPYYIPKTKGNTDDEVVLVNGKATQIPKGIHVELTPEVAEVLMNAEEQKSFAVDVMTAYEDEYREKEHNL